MQNCKNTANLPVSVATDWPEDLKIPMQNFDFGPLTVRQWWAYVGTDNVARVVAHMHTSLPYLRAIARRYKIPSYKFAKALIAAARDLTPGFAPDLDLVLQPLQPTAPRNLQRGPSPAYVRHQRYLSAIAQPTSVPPLATPTQITTQITAQASTQAASGRAP